jgi:hypothetical protein
MAERKRRVPWRAAARRPLLPAELRFFCAPVNTHDDFDACSEECRDGDSAKTGTFFELYYCDDWRKIWRAHRQEIEAEWSRLYPDPEERARHKRWALQDHHARIRQSFLDQIAKEKKHDRL